MGHLSLRLMAILIGYAAISACASISIDYKSMADRCDAMEELPSSATNLFFVSTSLMDCTENPKFTTNRTNTVRYGWAKSADGFSYSLAKYDQWKVAVRTKLTEGKSKRVIIYVHGYNNTPEDALARLDAIRIAARQDGPVIAMIWPSQAAIFKYLWDETNADWTTTYMRGLLWDIVPISDEIIVVAHSMGNRLALDAVRDMVRVRRAYASKVKHLVLSSPDVDRGTLQRDLHELDCYEIPATIYASLDDEPLHISWRLHGYPRAGDLNSRRRMRPFWWKQEALYFPITNKNAKLVDTSEVSTGLLGHADFIQSKEGAADLCRVLNDEKPEDGRKKIDAEGVSAWVLTEKPELKDTCAEVGKKAAKSLE